MRIGAPVLVAQTLHTLRNMYFVTTRLGPEAFSQDSFVYLTAMDVLSQYPIQAENFVREIRPATLGSIPPHPLDRCLDLFFLNTAEHFSLVLATNVAEDILIAAATPYLSAGGDNNLMHIFEAAHSVILSVFSAPQNGPLASKHLPFYADALFSVFPQNISARQFRFAFKTLVGVATPPSALAALEPDLPAILLEIVHNRATTASTDPLPQVSTALDAPPLSEQAVLVLTLLDALPLLPLEMLEEWLELSGELIPLIPDPAMRTTCQDRFWELLISGEMDPARSEICVSWWGTRGGRDLVVWGRQRHPAGQAVMSGALQAAERESKL